MYPVRLWAAAHTTLGGQFNTGGISFRMAAASGVVEDGRMGRAGSKAVIQNEKADGQQPFLKSHTMKKRESKGQKKALPL